MLYNEQYRPRYHFSPPENWLNDPNGLVYYEGEYHLFYQHHPFGDTWGPMHWGHAVSTDMLHWENLPIALHPDENGTIFSGCCIVDEKNVSGLFENGSGLVAIYTSHLDVPEKRPIEAQCLAYSNDKGRTWIKYEKNPIIFPDNPNLPEYFDFRDPKIIWDEENERFLMALGGGFVRFFTSKNLINWELLSETKIYEEFPDICRLPVEGTNGVKKYLLAMAGFFYFIGDFKDGHFIIEEGPYSGDYAKGCQAAQTVYAMPDGRTVWIAWLRDGSRGPTKPWRCCMSVPKELKLKLMADGSTRLIQRPIDELLTLRKPVFSKNHFTVSDNNNILSEIKGLCFDIEGSFLPPNNSVSIDIELFIGKDQTTLIRIDFENNFIFCDYTKSHDPSLRNLQSAFESDYYTSKDPVRLRGYCYHAPFPKLDRYNFRILMDYSTVEFYLAETDVEFSFCVYPDATADGLSLQANLPVEFEALNIYEMESVWN